MKHRTRYIQAGCLAGAIVLLAVAGLLHRPLAGRGQEANLLGEEDVDVLRQNPELSVITTLPGGLRVLAVNYLWIRSQAAHQAGRHFDAYQLAEAICQLQPYYPGVWAFQAWNMAWNISVTTFTREERWQWVYNGVKLLRDRGIPLNPRSLVLYKELSWIFVSKIAGRLDDMHWSYKARWAWEMQTLLGAPPYNEDSRLSLAEATQQTIDAFRPIAEAPLNRDRTLQGRDLIQPGAREQLLSDPAVAAYADRLATRGVEVDESLLEAWNAWSLDPSADVVRIETPEPATEQEQQLSDLINEPASAEPRAKLLAFVRAQILWNRYKMDPAFMLRLMERTVEHDGEAYPLPLDWRHAMSHGLYWAAYGLEVCDLMGVENMHRLNNMRNVLNSLKTLTSTGVVALQARPDDPLYPNYWEASDLRYIEPTHRQHLAFIARVEEIQKAEGKPVRDFADNILGSGHVNYLIDAMKMLVADARIAEAQRHFDFCKNEYNRDSADWQFARVQSFIVNDFARDPDLRYDLVIQLMQLSLKRALLARGVYGHEDVWQGRYSFAGRLYKAYQEQAVERMKLPESYDWVVADVLAKLLAQPRVFGVSLTLQQRSRLFAVMQDRPLVQAMAYHGARRPLQQLCQIEGVDFAQAFPEPPGYQEWLQRQQERMQGAQPHQRQEGK
ncbi:MAG: hypothetical protein GVY16_00455 [Planctomycetes bacterium]|jgi:hypothetical protein|nr:hypothetical protein [Planctomycetota bacterium]